MTIVSKNSLAYVKTYNSVLADIQGHGLTPGTRLVPLTELAKKYDVSYMTVQRAVKMLQEEGILEAQKGSGIFVKDINGIDKNKTSGEEGFTASSKSIANNVQNKTKPRNVCMVLPYWISGHGKAAIYSIVRGFVEIGEKQGWKSDLLFKEDNIVSLDFSNKILNRGIDGVLWIGPSPWDLTNIVRLIDNGLDVITTGRGFPEIPLDAVEADLLDLGAKIVQYCITNKHDNILILSANITNPFKDTISAEIVEGIRKSMREKNLPFSEERVCQVCMPPEELKHAKRALEEHPDVNAIVIMSETIFPAVEELDKKGFFKDPSSRIIINCTGDYGNNPGFVGRIPVAKVTRPYENIGQSAARKFIEKWGGEKGEYPDLKARIIEPKS